MGIFELSAEHSTPTDDGVFDGAFEICRDNSFRLLALRFEAKIPLWRSIISSVDSSGERLNIELSDNEFPSTVNFQSVIENERQQKAIVVAGAATDDDENEDEEDASSLSSLSSSSSSSSVPLTLNTKEHRGPIRRKSMYVRNEVVKTEVRHEDIAKKDVGFRSPSMTPPLFLSSKE